MSVRHERAVVNTSHTWQSSEKRSFAECDGALNGGSIRKRNPTTNCTQMTLDSPSLYVSFVKATDSTCFPDLSETVNL